jgi:hypothetical protein
MISNLDEALAELFRHSKGRLRPIRRHIFRVYRWSVVFLLLYAKNYVEELTE